MATGLGTPLGAALGGTLCTEKDAVTVDDPGTQTDNAGTEVDLTLASQDSEGHQLIFTASGLPAGLAINASTGAITGPLPTTAGAYAVTVTATAAITGASATRAFVWDVDTTTTTVRFYRCVHTCALINTHGASTYKPTKADYGRFLKQVTTVTTTTGTTVATSVTTRWMGPVTGTTAGDVSIGGGARVASTLTVKGSTGKALARVTVTKHSAGRFTLTVRRETSAKTQVWAYVVSKDAYDSGTQAHSVGKSVKLTVALKSAQTIKLVAVSS